MNSHVINNKLVQDSLEYYDKNMMNCFVMLNTLNLKQRQMI